MGEYYLLKFVRLNSDELFSREIMTCLGRLLNEFTHQFIASCLAVWSLHVAATTPANTSLTDYILKIVKESFHEVESNIMLNNLFDADQSIVNNHKMPTGPWPESMYLIVSGLIERIGNVAFNVLKSLLGRMQNDSKAHAKSSVFSRCVLLVLNKMKSGNKGSSENVTGSRLDAELVLNAESIVNDNQTLLKKSLQIALKSLRNN